MVRILVLSFLFKGESFSFVRGLWLLDLINRKIFFVDIFWICFASGVLRWWLENLLLPSIRNILWDLYSFFGIFVLSTGGRLHLGRFCRGASTRLDWFRLWQGVFISFIVIYDCILLLFCRSCFSFMIRQIWYCWRLLVQERGRIGHLEHNVGLRTHSYLPELIGMAGIIINKASTSISR